jgi:hypothetical protein
MAQEPQRTIHRVAQMMQFGRPMTEQELVTAAGVLGMYPARREASQARSDVLERLRVLGYDVDLEDAYATDGDLHDEAAVFATDGPGLAGDPRVEAQPLAVVPPATGPFQGGGGPRSALSLGAVRAAGACFLAIAAIAIWFGMAPDEVPSQAPAIAAALADYDSNNAHASGAPQQAVVNGWIARDLLTVTATQGNWAALAEQQASDRLAAEAALIVVALGFGIATRGTGRH